MPRFSKRFVDPYPVAENSVETYFVDDVGPNIALIIVPVGMILKLTISTMKEKNSCTFAGIKTDSIFI